MVGWLHRCLRLAVLLGWFGLILTVVDRGGPREEWRLYNAGAVLLGALTVVALTRPGESGQRRQQRRAAPVPPPPPGPHRVPMPLRPPVTDPNANDPTVVFHPAYRVVPVVPRRGVGGLYPRAVASHPVQTGVLTSSRMINQRVAYERRWVRMRRSPHQLHVDLADNPEFQAELRGFNAGAQIRPDDDQTD